MQCPACQTPDAYQGFKEVECVSPACKFFSQKLLSEQLQAAREKKEKEDAKPVDYPRFDGDDMLCGKSGVCSITLPSGRPGFSVSINGKIFRQGDNSDAN